MGKKERRGKKDRSISTKNGMAPKPKTTIGLTKAFSFDNKKPQKVALSSSCAHGSKNQYVFYKSPRIEDSPEGPR
jgi:hypothetical protein